MLTFPRLTPDQQAALAVIARAYHALPADPPGSLCTRAMDRRWARIAALSRPFAGQPGQVWLDAVEGYDRGAHAA